MGNNNQTNEIIRWLVVAMDFVLLNAILIVLGLYSERLMSWPVGLYRVFWIGCNIALMLSETKFSTVIHRRLISAGDVLRRLVLLTTSQALLAYLFMKAMFFGRYTIGRYLLLIGTIFFILLVLSRLIERMLVKRYRRMGRNMRLVTFVGSDPELLRVYEQLMNDPTMGYQFQGYYADEELKGVDNLKRLGSLQDLTDGIENQSDLQIVDELYVCLSRRERDLVRKLSNYCDIHVVRFYYVPVSVETLGINLKPELLYDMEVYATYENPLRNPMNKVVKRIFDIVMSAIALLIILPFIPVIALIIKMQSPKGGVFFKQPRTGVDGKHFYCYKFRSMHPNKDESGLVQATKDDPRKFPFGNFMRKANIDELPQFWNVLKGDMSIVGPRPHPVALNEMYAELIKKYMVRHFVKPGVTGWAQVTGYRGETKELWQMEERVRRDIWYMEHWTFWLDIRIIWLTAKSMVIHDKNAY